MNWNWITEPLALYGVIAVAAATALHLFISAKADLRRQALRHASDSTEMRDALCRLQARMDALALEAERETRLRRPFPLRSPAASTCISALRRCASAGAGRTFPPSPPAWAFPAPKPACCTRSTRPWPANRWFSPAAPARTAPTAWNIRSRRRSRTGIPARCTPPRAHLQAQVEHRVRVNVEVPQQRFGKRLRQRRERINQV